MVVPRHLDGGMERNPVLRVRSRNSMVPPQATPDAADMSGWRPGDPRPDRDSMLRVDQAGEYGATRIYAGQLAVMGDRAPHSGEIRAMNEQEHDHLRAFD